MPSKKRSADEEPQDSSALVDTATPLKKTDGVAKEKAFAHAVAVEDPELDFEDAYGDEYEEEDLVLDEEDEEEDEEGQVERDQGAPSSVNDENMEPEAAVKPYRPWADKLEEGEELVPTRGAYTTLHALSTEWPCLTFDVIPDSLGAVRTSFPHTAYLVSGTQADTDNKNSIIVMKLADITESKTRKDADDDEDEESDSDDDDETEGPKLLHAAINHPCTVNRIRACPQLPRLVATWGEDKGVRMWDIETQRAWLDSQEGKIPPAQQQAKFVFKKGGKKKSAESGHADEGYAIDFNPHLTAELLSGGNDGQVFHWKPTEASWNVSRLAKVDASVEDIQWKVKGAGADHTFAAGCTDKTVRIWDTRQTQTPIVIGGSIQSDVNVVAWSPLEENLLLAGVDDGNLQVFDCRNYSEPLVKNSWHKKPITSVCWDLTDSTSFVSSSEDDFVSYWDISVEPDDIRSSVDDWPQHMMFLHLGQKNVKEIKFHPQIPGLLITTAEDGFNLVRPAALS